MAVFKLEGEKQEEVDLKRVLDLAKKLAAAAFMQASCLWRDDTEGEEAWHQRRIEREAQLRQALGLEVPE